MTGPSRTAHRRRFLPFLLGLFLIQGCSTQVDLRPIDRNSSTTPSSDGRALLMRGKAAEAAAVYRRKLRVGGPNLQILNGLAIAYSALGRHDLAVEMFARALALAPDDATTLNNIGFAALRRADIKLARHYLEKAQARAPDLAEIEGNLSRLSLLETLDERRPSSRTPIELAPVSTKGQPAEIVRIVLPKSDHRTLQHKPFLQNASSRTFPK